jgi:hypothetical protein
MTQSLLKRSISICRSNSITNAKVIFFPEYCNKKTKNKSIFFIVFSEKGGYAFCANRDNSVWDGALVMSISILPFASRFLFQ